MRSQGPIADLGFYLFRMTTLYVFLHRSGYTIHYAHLINHHSYAKGEK